MTGHGTNAEYQQHRSRGEQPCQACREAHNQYTRRTRFRIGQQQDPARCRRCGSVFPQHQCGAP